MKRILFSVLLLISYIGMANAQGERFVGTWLATDRSKSYQITFTLGKETFVECSVYVCSLQTASV